MSRQFGHAYRVLIPSNVYGPHDNYSDGGHLVAAAVKKAHQATTTGSRKVEVWGDGTVAKAFGWEPSTALIKGLRETYDHDLETLNAL